MRRVFGTILWAPYACKSLLRLNVKDTASRIVLVPTIHAHLHERQVACKDPGPVWAHVRAHMCAQYGLNQEPTKARVLIACFVKTNRKFKKPWFHLAQRRLRLT
jgi:hypothetical protein